MFNPPYYFYLFKDVLNGVAGGFGDTKERAISFIMLENDKLEQSSKLEQELKNTEPLIVEYHPEMLIFAPMPGRPPVYAKCPKFGFYRANKEITKVTEITDININKEVTDIIKDVTEPNKEKLVHVKEKTSIKKAPIKKAPIKKH